MSDEMKPEPAVEFEGKISDYSEHAPMLANPVANALADELAARQAHLIGFTEKEINSLMRGPKPPIPPSLISNDVTISAGHISRVNTGKIAERIVANELEFKGFIVRDLNLGGVAPNVDLLAVKDGKVWQIQVKGCMYDHSFDKKDGDEHGWWFQYGYCKEEHIRNKDELMFNRVKGSFKADVVVLICLKTPSNYQSIVLPAGEAEKAAQINLDYAYRTKKSDGSDKKPNMVWTSFYIPKTSDAKKEAMEREQSLLRPYKDRWDIDVTSIPSSSLSTTKD